MNIIDPDNLIPDKSVLINIIKKHPFVDNLFGQINIISIHISNKPDVDLDLNSHNVIMHMYKDANKEDNYEHILYHEMGHVADKLNSLFLFSENTEKSLSNVEIDCLKEIWNISIDARLNAKGLFMLDKSDKNMCGTINGKCQQLEYSIDGRLCKHICFLQSRGISRAKEIVHGIWNNPDKFISYPDIIRIIKKAA